MLASWIFLASSLFPSAPVGDSVADPLARAVQPRSARIDTVGILRHGALEGAKILTAGDSIVYDLAEWLRDNVLHSRTSDGAIRSRLILREGDVADSVHLKEAGRLLRLEKFLAEAKVDTVRTLDNRLMLRTETWDRWSTALIASLNRSGGETNWSLGLREANLLGTGQDVGFAYTSSALNSGWTFNYANTAWLTPGGQFLSTYADLTDGHSLSGSFGLPSRSRYQTWAWLMEYQDVVSQRRVLATPSVQDHFTGLAGAQWTSDALFATRPQSCYRWVRASVAKLWGESDRAGLSLVAESELDSAGAVRFLGFNPDTSKMDLVRKDPVYQKWIASVPQRDDRRLGLSLSLRHLDYVKQQNFNQLKWTEDIPVGWQLSTLGLVNVLSRGDVRDDGVVQANASWTALTGSVYQALTAAWRSYLIGSDPQQGTSSARLELRWIPSRRFQAIGAVANDAVYGVPVYQSQLSLGEDNGLPGYSARSFTGRGRFLSTGELRWTPSLEAFTIAPALALFAGTGRVSDQPSFTGDDSWKTGIGVGLRFGMTRSPTGLVNHLSISWPVGDQTRDSWLISLGAKQSL